MRCPEFDDLVIATEPENRAIVRAAGAPSSPRACEHASLPGGATRQESVARALAAVPAHCDAVFVHDGARPLVAADDVRAGMAATQPGVGALLAAPVVDTIKVVADRRAHASCGRSSASRLWAAQTPQFAMLADLRDAHARARRDGFAATDDATLLERAGCTRRRHSRDRRELQGDRRGRS